MSSTGFNREMLALAGAAGALYLLAGLQLNHLVAVLVVSLWAAIALFWSGWRNKVEPFDGEGGAPKVGELKFLATNAKFVEIVTAIAPLKRFDRARFRELGELLDAFQKKYMYAMSGRSPVAMAVPDLKDSCIEILRVAYSLYVVVPRVGKHFYGENSLWQVLDDAVQALRETLSAMVEVVQDHAANSGVEVPNDTGQEPASRLMADGVASDLP